MFLSFKGQANSLTPLLLMPHLNFNICFSVWTCIGLAANNNNNKNLCPMIPCF